MEFCRQKSKILFAKGTFVSSDMDIPFMHLPCRLKFVFLVEIAIKGQVLMGKIVTGFVSLDYSPPPISLTPYLPPPPNPNPKEITVHRT